MNGKFIISLDFELMWGVFDKKTKENYGEDIYAVREVIDRLLEIFRRFEIKVTFATVGFLFAKNKKELTDYIPKIKPNYKNNLLDPYKHYIGNIGKNELEDKYHYAHNVLKKIARTSKHEIGSHTFSHYYCLEQGQSDESFKADLVSAKKIAEKENITIESIIFPRNQYNYNYDKILIENGIKYYRGNENAWFYKEKSSEDESLFRRGFRLLDSYLNISGHNCFRVQPGKLVNVPSSRFLRPFNPKFRILEALRLRRIKKSMTYAAKNRLVYHLWWHPHNFGSFQNENFLFLEAVLNHYEYLNKKYNFDSCTMNGVLK